MDSYDLLATTPTGSEKTGHFIVLMIVVYEMSADETLALGKKKIPPWSLFVQQKHREMAWCVHFDGLILINLAHI